MLLFLSGALEKNPKKSKKIIEALQNLVKVYKDKLAELQEELKRVCTYWFVNVYLNLFAFDLWLITVKPK